MQIESRRGPMKGCAPGRRGCRREKRSAFQALRFCLAAIICLALFIPVQAYAQVDLGERASNEIGDLIYPGSVLNASESKVDRGKNGGTQYVFSSSDQPEAIVEFYRRKTGVNPHNYGRKGEFAAIFTFVAGDITVKQGPNGPAAIKISFSNGYQDTFLQGKPEKKGAPASDGLAASARRDIGRLIYPNSALDTKKTNVNAHLSSYVFTSNDTPEAVIEFYEKQTGLAAFPFAGQLVFNFKNGGKILVYKDKVKKNVGINFFSNSGKPDPFSEPVDSKKGLTNRQKDLMHLGVAIGDKDLDRVAYLIKKKGVDVNARMNSLDLTPLIMATNFGGVEMTKWLLRNGADPRLRTAGSDDPVSGDMTAFEGVIGTDDEELWGLFLEKGLDVNEKSMYLAVEDSTPVMNAAFAGNLKLVNFLVSNGASLDANKYNDSALSIAAGRGHEEVVRYLLDLKFSQAARNKALMNAAYGNHAGTVRLLLENGADVNGADRLGETALIKAVRAGHVDMVKSLLASGARVDMKDKLGKTALFYATAPKQKQGDAIARLLRGGGQ